MGLHKFMGKEMWDRILSLIYSISKSNALKIAYHLAKIWFDAMFSTSFFKIYFADLQSILNKKKFIK
jgi:hypothetical protein